MVTTEAMVGREAGEVVLLATDRRRRSRVIDSRLLSEACLGPRAAARPKEGPMVGQDAPDPQFDAMTARLLRREALRRAARR